jgi:hypothetical protein
VAVLIVTNEQDLAADYVVLELQRREVEVLRCNAERFPRWRVFLRPGHDWRLTDARARTISSGSTTGVWWRRPEAPILDAAVSEAERRTLVEQWNALAEGLASVPGPRWVSRPSAIAAAEDKANQLAAARTVGFSVPETVWTNDLSRAQSLRTLQDDTLPEDPDAFAAAPVALQHRIHPRHDIRATVIGEAVLAAETTTASLDWRTTPARDGYRTPSQTPLLRAAERSSPPSDCSSAA